MSFIIKAEGGDVITVDNSQLGLEQELVYVQLDNPVFHEAEIDRFSLSAEQARNLARALIAASRLVERESDRTRVGAC